MKLTDTTDHQQSDESLFGDTELSFSFRTRTECGDEIVEKEYTFAHAKEWDEWTFSQYVERRCSASVKISERSWDVVQDIDWMERQEKCIDVTVPQPVIDKLNEMVSAEININN